MFAKLKSKQLKVAKIEKTEMSEFGLFNVLCVCLFVGWFVCLFVCLFRPLPSASCQKDALSQICSENSGIDDLHLSETIPERTLQNDARQDLLPELLHYRITTPEGRAGPLSTP
jgi:hypothetical protein